MLSALHRQLLRTLRQRLEGRFGQRVRKVCLYGSWARGEATERSDTDVAIVIDGLSPAEWQEASRLAAETEADTELFFSPLILSTARFEELKRNGGIGADIERDGLSP